MTDGTVRGRIADEEIISPRRYYSIFNKRETWQRSTRECVEPKKTVVTSRPSARRPRLRADGAGEQLVIDVGQLAVAAIQCPDCGMVYTPCDDSDSRTHRLYHDATAQKLRFLRRKTEDCLAEYSNGRIVRVRPGDPRGARCKAAEIDEAINAELGNAGQRSAADATFQYFLYVSDEKSVVGCLIAEIIGQAYRMLDDRRAACCSTRAEKAVCGIRRLWTHASHRRKRIASRLMNCLRANFLFGYFLSTDDIAFSSPSPDGLAFAEKYTGTREFLVYG